MLIAELAWEPNILVHIGPMVARHGQTWTGHGQTGQKGPNMVQTCWISGGNHV